jgi:hypothetical protein
MSQENSSAPSSESVPSNSYSRESAGKRLKSFGPSFDEQKRAFDDAINRLGYSIDQVSEWFLDKRLLEDEKVEEVVRQLALLRTELLSAKEQKDIGIAAKNLAAYIEKTFE